LAVDRPLVGGGFSALERDKIRFRYAKSKTTEVGRAAHSMWFQVLGDHGFIGLFLYLGIIFAAIYNALRIVSLSKTRDNLAWATLLSRMIVVMFAGYFSAGSLLSMAYYDAFLVLVGLTAALRVIVEKEVASTSEIFDDLAEPVPATAGWRSAFNRK
jgi:O-antigen ligase